jgi:hypothetical protein
MLACAAMLPMPAIDAHGSESHAADRSALHGESYEWNEVGHAYSHAPPDMSGAQRRLPLNRDKVLLEKLQESAFFASAFFAMAV